MPDQKPNNSPDAVVDRTEVGEPAAALQDLAGAAPGGGGLGGASAAEGSAHGKAGPSPNRPADAVTPDEGKEAQAEAPGAAVDDAAVPVHPESL